MRIRRPTAEDAEDIAELSRESWINGFKDCLIEKEIEMAREYEFFDVESLKEDLKDDEMVYLVAEINGIVVGKMKFCWGENNTHSIVDPEENQAELRSVYVHPDYWRQGIGTQLWKDGREKLPDRIETVKVETLK